MTDAFAEASAAHSQQAQQNTAAPQSVTASGVNPVDDPFLTGSQVNSGASFGPRVPFEDIIGRLVVMVPQSFTEKSTKAERFRKNADDLYQPVADVDLIVLDGDPFEFTYEVPDPDNKDAKVYETHAVNEFPYVEKARRLFNAGLAWQAKRTMDQRGLMLGVMAYGPASRKAGGDIDSVTASVQAWIKAGRRGESPRHTFALDDRPHVLTPARKQIAGAWWSEYRKTL